MILPGRRPVRLSVILPLTATLGVSVLLFVYSRRQEDTAVRQAFAERARTLASAVRVSCARHLEVLVALNALFASDPEVSQEEFGRFVSRSLDGHPGIRGLSWNPRVAAADRARFEAETGAAITQLDAAGRRLPAAPRAEYVVVRYVEPATDLKAVGLDVAFEPVRREALFAARDTGKIAATGPIRLFSDRSDQRSVLVFDPVYETGPAPTTVAGRRRAIRGYTTAAFGLGDLVETALKSLPRADVAVALFDRGFPGAAGWLYSDAQWAGRADEAAGGLAHREPFGFGGRQWEVRVTATPAFEREHGSRYAWFLLLGGVLFSVLLGALLVVVTSRTAQVEELVVRRTAELENELKERQRAEAGVRMSEARNRDILEHMLGGMITFSAQSRIESVNPAAERVFGYREDELVGRSVAVLLADVPAESPDPFLREMHGKSIGRVTETWGRRKNGELFCAEVALFEFEAPEGRRFAGNFQDVTERREVDRLKSEFVSTVSHELRTPLTSIRGSLGLLAGGVLGKLSPEVLDLLRLAERNSVRLTALINDILDFERLDSGRVAMRSADVDLQPLFEQSLDSVRSMADEQRVALVVAPTDLRLRADGARVVQVLINLISNAVKFSSLGCQVRVWAEARGDAWVRIVVQDQGPGIPANYQQRIFERFVHVETAEKRDKAGTGLGLAICKAIVEHHGGRIGVDSEPGRGSTFWFELPRASTPSVAVDPVDARGVIVGIHEVGEALAVKPPA